MAVSFSHHLEIILWLSRFARQHITIKAHRDHNSLFSFRIYHQRSYGNSYLYTGINRWDRKFATGERRDLHDARCSWSNLSQIF